jgi:hypothetical protein
VRVQAVGVWGIITSALSFYIGVAVMNIEVCASFLSPLNIKFLCQARRLPRFFDWAAGRTLLVSAEATQRRHSVYSYHDLFMLPVTNRLPPPSPALQVYGKTYLPLVPLKWDFLLRRSGRRLGIYGTRKDLGTNVDEV